jgi:hypothetical protein
MKPPEFPTEIARTELGGRKTRAFGFVFLNFSKSFLTFPKIVN